MRVTAPQVASVIIGVKRGHFKVVTGSVGRKNSGGFNGKFLFILMMHRDFWRKNKA